MSNMLTGNVSGINTVQDIIPKTITKINRHPVKEPPRPTIDNTIDTSTFNAGQQIKKIYEEYNDFITEEMQKTQTQISSETSDVNQLLKLEDLLCEKSTLFSSEINDLHKQIEQDVILNPKTEIHETIEKKLHNIITSLKDFDAKLSFLEKDVKEKIYQNMDAANEAINRIQIVNIELSKISSAKHPDQEQVLLNAREALVETLNKIIEVKVVKKDDNYKIMLHDEIALIDNTKAENLGIVTSLLDTDYIGIGYKDNNSHPPKLKNVEHMISNGQLSSLLKFRKEELKHTRNKISQLTINFANNINSYNLVGYDKYGEIGRQFLKISQPEIILTTSKLKSVLRSVIWEDISHAKDTDYKAVFKDQHWTITRLSDNQLIPTNQVNEEKKPLFTSVHFDGMIFNIDKHAHEGDSYIIKPYPALFKKLVLLINNKYASDFFPNVNPQETRTNYTSPTYQFNQDFRSNNGETFDDAYQNFTKNIIYKRRCIEDGIPFKRKLLDILSDKKMSMSHNLDQDYYDLTFQQTCYTANNQVLKTAEKILRDIIEGYS